MARLTYSKAVAALKNGETAMITHKNPFKLSDKDGFSLSGGGIVTASVWAKLAPHLAPLNDGLFPDDASSQTFTWAVE